MAERDLFEHRRPLGGSGSLSCDEWELLLTESLDGLLPAAQRIDFDAHAAGCSVCAELLEQARQGQEWGRRRTYQETHECDKGSFHRLASPEIANYYNLSRRTTVVVPVLCPPLKEKIGAILLIAFLPGGPFKPSFGLSGAALSSLWQRSEVAVQGALSRRMKRTRAEHLPPHVHEAAGRRLGRKAALRRDWSCENLRRRARLHADLFADCCNWIAVAYCLLPVASPLIARFHQ